jgi:hypothetical protein
MSLPKAFCFDSRTKDELYAYIFSFLCVLCGSVAKILDLAKLLRKKNCIFRVNLGLFLWIFDRLWIRNFSSQKALRRQYLLQR